MPPPIGPGYSMVLVDDDPDFRAIATDLLCGKGVFRLVGQAGAGQQAVDVVLSTRPDLVIMDIMLPDISGVEATRLLRARLPHLKVIAVSLFRERRYAELALAAGAVAFLPKKDLSAAAILSLLAC